MNKFWKWMEEKGYRETDFLEGYNDWMHGIENDKIPHQMLIGYMIEYLCDENDINLAEVFEWVEALEFEDFYRALKSEIKKIGGDAGQE